MMLLVILYLFKRELFCHRSSMQIANTRKSLFAVNSVHRWVLPVSPHDLTDSTSPVGLYLDGTAMHSSTPEEEYEAGARSQDHTAGRSIPIEDQVPEFGAGQLIGEIDCTLLAQAIPMLYLGCPYPRASMHSPLLVL